MPINKRFSMEVGMRLAGKVAIITGAARDEGIGAATARMFANEGAKVVCGDVREIEGRALADEICSAGGEAIFVVLDVALENDWIKAIEATVSAFGRLDILVNNAGLGARGSIDLKGRQIIDGTSLEAWDKVMAVNMTGVFLGTKHAIPVMRNSGGGSIINTSSQMGIVGARTSGAAYQTSKGAVRMFTKTTAVQHADDGIRANSIHPGPIATRMGDSSPPSKEQQEFVNSKMPMGRSGRPEEIAYGMLFLASDESSYMTGSELVIDGGWTAW